MEPGVKQQGAGMSAARGLIVERSNEHPWNVWVHVAMAPRQPSAQLGLCLEWRWWRHEPGRATYRALRVHVDWAQAASEIPDVVVGWFLGPTLNQYLNEKALKTFVAPVLFGTGIYYVLT